MTININTLNQVDKLYGEKIMILVETATDKLLSNNPAGWVKTFDSIQDSILNLRLTKITMAIADRITRENREFELEQKLQSVSNDDKQALLGFVYINQNRIHDFCELVDGLEASIERDPLRITLVFRGFPTKTFKTFRATAIFFNTCK